MRTLKTCMLGLTLLASACDQAEIGGKDLPPAQAKALAPRSTEDPNKDTKEDAAKRELQRLEGTWIALDVEHDGDMLTDAGALKWIIRNGRYGVYLDQQKRETWTLKLDPTRNPKTIEARLVIGPAWRRLAGIYEVDGNELKVCYDLTGKDFPTEFSAPKSGRRVNYVFRRE